MTLTVPFILTTLKVDENGDAVSITVNRISPTIFVDVLYTVDVTVLDVKIKKVCNFFRFAGHVAGFDVFKAIFIEGNIHSAVKIKNLSTDVEGIRKNIV